MTSHQAIVVLSGARCWPGSDIRRVVVVVPPQNATTAHAWELAPTTFGGAYAKFMGDRNFQADERCVPSYLLHNGCMFIGSGWAKRTCYPGSRKCYEYDQQALNY